MAHGALPSGQIIWGLFFQPGDTLRVISWAGTWLHERSSWIASLSFSQATPGYLGPGATIRPALLGFIFLLLPFLQVGFLVSFYPVNTRIYPRITRFLTRCRQIKVIVVYPVEITLFYPYRGLTASYRRG